MLNKSLQRCVAIAIAIAGITLPAAADNVTVLPIKDNTLIEEPTGGFSNGQGSIFCGRTGFMGGQTRRRLVVAFNIAASVPAGSTITSASLVLRLEQTSLNNPNPQTHTLHRLLADWGEGTSFGIGGGGALSEPNDATWLHRFYPTSSWATPGGDYVTTSTASASVGVTFVDYTWTSAQLAADVQAMLDRPACSFGWLMLGNESANNTAKKFFSLQTGDATTMPRLVLVFTPPTVACPTDIDHSNAVDINDLLEVINNWGACPACPADCDADISPVAGDQQVNINDLLDVINTWGPCS